MKPAKRSDQELLAWAAAIIEKAQREEMHGEVVIQLKGGRIQSVKVMASHLPPNEA